MLICGAFFLNSRLFLAEGGVAPRPRAPPHCKQVSRGTSSVERRDHPCQHGGPRHSHMMLPKKRSARPCETMRHGRSGLAAHTVSPPPVPLCCPIFSLFISSSLHLQHRGSAGRAPCARESGGTRRPPPPPTAVPLPPFVRRRGTHGTIFFCGEMTPRALP